MVAAPKHPNEKQRLKALEEYNIMDTLPEKEYDRIVQLASFICDAPISLISLVDLNRQWFKAKVGLDASETHRDLAFCAHAILNPEKPLVVEDTAKDPRFSGNGLVTGDPHIRFYAGFPLNTPTGDSLGTLCVIDRKPKTLTDEQLNALSILSDNVMAILELRLSKKRNERLIQNLNESNEKLEAFAAGTCHDLKVPVRVINSLVFLLEKDLKDSIDEHNIERIGLIRKNTASMSKLIDDVMSYSRLDFDRDNIDILSVTDILEEIKSLLDIPSCFEFIIHDTSFVEGVMIPRMPAIQIFRNLIQNALKHHHKECGKIEVSVKKADDYYHFSVKDDGPGIASEDHDKVFEIFQTLESNDKLGNTGLGLAMVQKLVKSVDGNIKVESEKGKGANFIFTLPVYE